MVFKVSAEVDLTKVLLSYEQLCSIILTLTKVQNTW